MIHVIHPTGARAIHKPPPSDVVRHPCLWSTKFVYTGNTLSRKEGGEFCAGLRDILQMDRPGYLVFCCNSVLTRPEQAGCFAAVARLEDPGIFARSDPTSRRSQCCAGGRLSRRCYVRKIGVRRLAMQIHIDAEQHDARKAQHRHERQDRVRAADRGKCLARVL